MALQTVRPEGVKRFVCETMMFGRFKRLFFVGIGGAGMSGIAEILHNLGYQIKGSDTTPSEITEYLHGLGIAISPQHEAGNVADSDVVVISSAVGENNPEVVEARRLGLPVIKRAEMLGELMRLKFSVAVAGTHGKTTTTSMIGRILRAGKLHPTLIVGGVVSELGTGADLGEGDYMVVEADEYDRSIFSMFPGMAVVLNIEEDHLDCYEDTDDLRGAFLSFINRVPFYGSAVVPADDPNVALIRDHISRPYVTFGESVEADYRAVEITEQPGRTMFSVYRRGELLGEVILRVPGRHNALNALAAVAAVTELDVPFETTTDALREFTGVSRRFEKVGTVNDIVVIDDYAHHPTEIAACLATARANFERRIVAVFQPHLYSRTARFLREFAESLSKADLCILTDIYPAREEPIPGVTSDSIREEAAKLGYSNFEYVGKKKNAAAAVARNVRPGDVVLIIGAGSITHIRQPVMEVLESITR